MKNNILKQSHFLRLYNGVQARLYSYLLVLIHNHNDAEDILQEVAVVLWENFDQFKEGTSFGAWAVKIASNKAMEFLRKNKKCSLFFDEDFYEAISRHAQESTEDVPERLNALRFCLQKAPEHVKQLLAMRYMKDITMRQISDLTGRSANGLYQSFSKIISTLRNCMDKYIAREIF